MAQQALVAASATCFSLPHGTARGAASPARALPPPFASSRKASALASPFKRGSPHNFWISSKSRSVRCQTALVSIRCEQGAKESGGLDIWLGRLAMVGFATVITVEISTGKGLLESFGFTSPLPTVALALTALVGVLTAVFIFQSSSRD